MVIMSASCCLWSCSAKVQTPDNLPVVQESSSRSSSKALGTNGVQLLHLYGEVDTQLWILHSPGISATSICALFLRQIPHSVVHPYGRGEKLGIHSHLGGWSGNHSDCFLSLQSRVSCFTEGSICRDSSCPICLRRQLEFWQCPL